MGGWVGGWMDGRKSRSKDCLQQSKNSSILKHLLFPIFSHDLATLESTKAATLKGIAAWKELPFLANLTEEYLAKIDQQIEDIQAKKTKVPLYPPASEASREVENFDWRKKHTYPYMVSKFCLSVTFLTK